MRVAAHGLALVLVMWTSFALSWVALALMRVSRRITLVAHRMEVAYVLAKAQSKVGGSSHDDA